MLSGLWPLRRHGSGRYESGRRGSRWHGFRRHESRSYGSGWRGSWHGSWGQADGGGRVGVRLLAAIGAFTLGLSAVGLSGCLAPAQAKTVVTVWYPWTNLDGDLFLQRVKEYNESQDRVEIKPVVLDGAGVSTGKLMTTVAAGKAPDLVVTWALDWTGPLAAAKVIQPVTPYLKQAGIHASDYFPAAWRWGMYRGEVYTVPEMANVSLLFYNTTAYEAAGMDSARPPQTVAELDAAAQKLTLYADDHSIKRMGFVPWSWQGHSFLWTWAFGGNVYEKGKLGVSSSEAVAALQWHVSYMNRFGTAAVDNFLKNDEQNGGREDFFASGQLAMRVEGEWRIRDYTEAKRDFAVAPVPTVIASRPRPSWVFGNVWMVPSGSLHPLEAMRFVAWFNSPERSREIADRVRNISPLIAAAQGQQLIRDSLFRVAIEQTGSPGAGTWPVTKHLSRIQQEMSGAFWTSIHQGTSPEVALKQAQATLTGYISTVGGFD